MTDSSGAVVSNATVKITEAATGVTRQTTTNGAGIYRFDAVDLDTTGLSAGQGFSGADQSGVGIQSARVSLTLIFP